MAVIKASNTAGFDISDIDFTEILSGATLTGDTTSFTATNAAGFSLDVVGEGFFYASQIPINGEVNSFKLSFQGALLADISGIELSVIAVAQAAFTPSQDDDLALLAATLAGNDTFLGGKLGDLFGGFGGNDTFSGGDGADTIFGGEGNDRLNGGLKIDTLRGEAGNDTYDITLGDKIFEGSAVGSGTDTVNASFNYVLGANFENLNLVANSRAVSAIGNGEVNALKGNALNNILNGKAGADTMTGLFGNDRYYVDNVGDKAIEGASGGRADIVYSTATTYTLGANVENLTLQGAGDIDGKGNQSGNRIVGNTGDNELNGSFGADILTGGRGLDVFVFSTRLLPANVDEITDFSVRDDTIHIDNAAFAGLTAGDVLAEAAFDTGAVAGDGSVRIVYNSANGALLFDRDGDGTRFAAVKFAELDRGLVLTHEDFVVI